MQSIVIQPKNKKEFAFIRELLEKMDIKMRLLDEEPNQTTINAVSEKDSPVYKSVSMLMKELNS